MSRIATASTYDASVNQLVRRQAELNDSQDKLTSGKRVQKASDDPAAAARVERALATSAQIAATKRGVDASQSVMTQTESALGDAGNLMQSARELVVSAGDGSYGDEERKSMATQLSGIRDQLMQIANSSDGAGGYLFGGQGSLKPPFINGAGGVQYAGDGGRLTVGAAQLPLSYSGADGWLNASTGNGVFQTQAVAGNTGTGVIDGGSVIDAAAYHAQLPSSYDIAFSVTAATATTPASTTYTITQTPLPPSAAAPVVGTPQAFVSGQSMQIDGMQFNVAGAPADGDKYQITPATQSLSVFSAIDKAISDLNTTGRTNAQVAQSNADNLTAFDSVLSKLQLGRSDAGNALNLIGTTGDRLDGQALQATTERSSAEDLDMVAAISDFQNKQTGYDAALKSYAMVQKMSLFQYLGS